MGIPEKIKKIQDEMNRTQKNKATEHHLGYLKGKIAKLNVQLLEESKKKSITQEGFDCIRSGDARIALIGFPSVGKSSFLNEITNTNSESASYEFTTLNCIPGNLIINDTTIQILDLPGIVEGAANGKGRGKEVIGVARNSDCIIMMIDAKKSNVMIKKLTEELYKCGIRLNQEPVDIIYKKKKEGGIKFTSTVQLRYCNQNIIKKILQNHKIHHAEILFHEDITTNQFIDVILGNRKYLPCLYVHNKIDNTNLEECDRLAYLSYSIVCSVKKGWNLNLLKERLWKILNLKRIFCKPKGGIVDLDEPIILKKGKTIKDVVRQIHRNLLEKFKYAIVWGKSSKFFPKPQRVGLNHIICDCDVVEIVSKI